ncbi:MAG: hypothetical protein V1816_23155, partial [Pseudomonadota bacterium]
ALEVVTLIIIFAAGRPDAWCEVPSFTILAFTILANGYEFLSLGGFHHGLSAVVTQGGGIKRSGAGNYQRSKNGVGKGRGLTFPGIGEKIDKLARKAVKRVRLDNFRFPGQFPHWESGATARQQEQQATNDAATYSKTSKIRSIRYPSQISHRIFLEAKS